MGLREWQRDAAERYFANRGQDFLVEATPGAGKTRFACHIASEHSRSGVDRVIVVVPTFALKEQWAASLHVAGLDCEHRWSNQSCAWPSGFEAIAVTYQQVAQEPQLFRKHSHGAFVILDEIHHCSDEADWGRAIQSAFAPAKHRLALSGTPFRSDNNEIPFVRYTDGKANPHFIYGYDDALRDGVCRFVFFPRLGGRFEWSTPGGEMRHKTFDDAMPEAEVNQRLRTALHAGGDWMRDTIRDANRALADMRRDDADAGGLIIAIDAAHAKQIARLLASQFGIEPAVILSEDEKEAHAKLKRFRDSSEPWVVAVKMISEGIDIPRLRVGVYATTCTTEMFFRQAVGRFVRTQDGHEDHTAEVFIPDDPRLRQFAEHIKEQVHHRIEEENEKSEREASQDRDLDNDDISLYSPIASTLEYKGHIFEEESFSPEEMRIAEAAADGLGVPAAKAALILRKAGVLPSTAKAATPAPTRTKSDEKKLLKTRCNTLARRIGFALGEEYSHVNQRLNQLAGVRKFDDSVSVEQIKSRIAHAIRWLKEGGVNVESEP